MAGGYGPRFAQGAGCGAAGQAQRPRPGPEGFFHTEAAKGGARAEGFSPTAAAKGGARALRFLQGWGRRVLRCFLGWGRLVRRRLVRRWLVRRRLVRRSWRTGRRKGRTALLDVLGWVDERVDEGVVRLLLCFIIPANGSALGRVGSDEGLLRLWLHRSRQWFSIGVAAIGSGGRSSARLRCFRSDFEALSKCLCWENPSHRIRVSYCKHSAL